MTITEFLLARIAEDDASAPAPSRPMPSDADYVHAMCGDCGGCSQMRWLAECDAKRRIVEQWERISTRLQVDLDQTQGWETLRVLASVYSDHPDYRQEWRL